MGISAVGASQRIEVEGQKTVVSRADIRGAIAKAYESQTGKKPSAQLLDTLTAQASLETGSGSAMYNYNFGGIKGGAPGTHETARLRTKEVYDGKEVEVKDGFRAYRSLDAGADDYVHLLRNKFGAAVDQAEAGNINGFAHALKQAHYYTADESKYASALNTLAGRPDGAASATSSLQMVTKAVAASNTNIAAAGDLGGLNSYSSSNDFQSTLDLGKIFDSIAKHPQQVEEDEDDE